MANYIIRKGAYMERYIREVRVRDLITYFFFPFLFFAMISVSIGLTAVFLLGIWKFLIIAAEIIILYFDAKYLLIGSILMYKAFAPMKIRNKCRFDPCCSTYMIIAVQKYGLIRGFIKGIRRIIRCKPPNGGTDLP